MFDISLGFVMPPPLGAGGIMLSCCPSVRLTVRPSEAWNTLYWPVHGSVGPPDQPWPFYGMSVCPSGSVVLGADESPWPCGTPSWYTPLSWMILSKQKNLHLFSSQWKMCFSLKRPFVHGLFVSWGDYLLWILAQTSMSQMTVQQSYLLCWELLPDRNRKSMGLWYWELMSHPDPVVLPVSTLYSLEWFWVSRRIFVYSHHNTIVFFSKMSVHPSVRPSVRRGFRAFSGERMDGMAWNITSWCILTTYRTD